MLVLSAHAMVGYDRRSDKDDWRAASRYVLASARPNDAVVFFPSYGVTPFEYYRASVDTTAASASAIHPARPSDGSLGVGLPHVREGAGRLWAVFNEDEDMAAAARASLRRRYSVMSDRQFTGVRVILYDAR